MKWGFATSFTACRQGTAPTHLWVDKWAVCSVLNLDTFTLVTVILNDLIDLEMENKISMKAD